MTINVWEFPREDFLAWKSACGGVATPQVATYEEYRLLLAGVQADQERQGRRVLRVRLTVADMIAALAERGLSNTPDNRAAIIAARKE